MKKPSEKDMAAARKYLLRRLDAELSMVRNAELLMKEAAEKIVSVLYEFNLTANDIESDDIPMAARRKIDEIINRLYESIMESYETLAVEVHEENRDELWPLVMSGEDAELFSERLYGYVNNWRREIMVLVAAGLFLGLTKMMVSQSIKTHMRKPWRNPDLADGIARPLTYGRGRTNSMATAISTLTKYGVGKAWMQNRHLEAQLKEAIGFYTFRNSTCPCSMCDDYAEVFHPMGDATPPIHANCVCGTVYVNALGEFLNF